MRKLKLLLAAVALLFGVTATQAKDNVTATYLTDADLSALTGWGNPGRTDWKTDGAVNVVEFWNWSSQFSFTQNAKLPAGYYRLAVNAFYRHSWGGNGTNNDMAWILAHSDKLDYKKNVVALNSMGDLSSYAGSNDLYRAATAFSLGNFSNEFDFNVTTADYDDGQDYATVEIGFKGTCPDGGWCILGPVTLWEYTAEDYVDDYDAKYAIADGIKDSPMNATVHSELLAAMVDKSTLSTVDEAKAAIETLVEKTAAANASIAIYASTKAALDTYASQAVALNAIGEAAYNSAVEGIQTAYANGTMTDDQSAAVLAAFITGYKAQGEDKTALITNPSFETGMTGWTCTTGGDTDAKPNSNPTYTMSNVDGDYVFNTWNSNAGQPITQTITGIPTGMYYLTAIMGTDAGKTLELYGNSTKGYAISVDKGTGVFVTVENVVVVDGNLTITAGTADNYWYKADDFSLIFMRDLTDTEVLDYAKDNYDEALQAAKDAYDAHDNAKGGSEGIALKAEIDKTEPTTADGYNDATAELKAKTATFNAAYAAYDTYVAYKAETEALFGTDFGVAAPTTAAEAAKAVQDLNIAQYDKVATDYPYSMTSKIGDFSTWIGTAKVGDDRHDGTPNSLSWEHWSGTTHPYYEQDASGWSNAGGWTIQYTKTTTLKAGSYVVKVAARSSEGVTSSVSCSEIATTISLPCAGNRTRGIATDGKASWADDDEFVYGTSDYAPAVGGKGAGWQWRFLPFTLSEEKEVTMTFYAEASSINQWMSIADGELLSANDLATAVSYNETSTNTIADVDVANVTISREIKAGFNTVVLPFDLTLGQVESGFGAGAKVYAYSEDSSDPSAATINFNLVTAGTISANVPVLVKTVTASSSQMFNGVQIVASTDVKVAGTNYDFVGIYAPIATVPAKDYFIGNGAIYRSTGATSMNAFRAYIHAKSSEARIANFYIDGVEATAIEALQIAGENNGKIYNLNGQEVKSAKKGLYIQNGKKYVVK